MLLKLLDLMYDGTGSTEFVPKTLSGASRNQQGVITVVMMDTMLTQPSDIREAVSSSEKTSGVPNPPAMATGSVGDSQPVAAPAPGGNCCAPMAYSGLIIPQKGGLMDIKMGSVTVGASIDQEAVSSSVGVLRVPNTPLAGTGVDGGDQTVAVEPPGGKGPLTVLTGMEEETSDKQKDHGTSPAQKRLPQTSMITPRISRHIPINKAHLEYINSDPDAIKGIKNTRPCSEDNGETCVSMMVNHRNQGEPPSTKVYECIQKFYKLLCKADPMATINPLYDKEEEDAHKFIPTTDPVAFPSDMLGLHNPIQISNLYTMSPANGKDDRRTPSYNARLLWCCGLLPSTP